MNLNNSEIDIYNLESPTECYKLKIVAYITVFLFLSTLLINSFLLYISIKYKVIHSSLNFFIIILLCLNLFGTIFEIPFIIISNFSCRFDFSINKIQLLIFLLIKIFQDGFLVNGVVL